MWLGKRSIENVVKSVADHMGKDANAVFEQVKAHLITFFKNQLDSQVLLHFKELLNKEFSSLTNFTNKTIIDVVTEIDKGYNLINKQNLYDITKSEFEKIIDDNDYDAVLRFFNLKNALVPHSKICELTGLKNKDEYLNMVITLLKKNNDISNNIRVSIESKIIKN